MDSSEANSILKEIRDAMEEDNLEAPIIEVQTRDSKGYSVCIKTFLGAAKKQTIEAIAQKHKLTLTEEPEGLVLS